MPAASTGYTRQGWMGRSVFVLDFKNEHCKRLTISSCCFLFIIVQLVMLMCPPGVSYAKLVVGHAVLLLQY